METQEIINQVKQDNQENDIIMSNQEIKEKVRQQMNKMDNPDNQWLEIYKELGEDLKELFRKEYYGTWEVNRLNPCQGCPNDKPNRFCHCTLGSMVIEA